MTNVIKSITGKVLKLVTPWDVVIVVWGSNRVGRHSGSRDGSPRSRASRCRWDLNLASGT